MNVCVCVRVAKTCVGICECTESHQTHCEYKKQSYRNHPPAIPRLQRRRRLRCIRNQPQAIRLSSSCDGASVAQRKKVKCQCTMLPLHRLCVRHPTRTHVDTVRLAGCCCCCCRSLSVAIKIAPQLCLTVMHFDVLALFACGANGV